MKKTMITRAATLMATVAIAVTALPMTAFAASPCHSGQGRDGKKYAPVYTTTTTPTTTQTFTGPVTKDQALQIALTHAGYKQSEVQFPIVKKDYDDGMEVWEVEFHKGFIEYNYDIEVSTGQIVDFDIDD